VKGESNMTENSSSGSRGFTSKKLTKIKEEHKMRKRRGVTVPVVTISLVAIALMISGLLVAATGEGNLISVKVTSTPKLDGSGSDAVWRDVPELKVQAKDGPEISLRSVYTSDSLYMLISWEDKTESVNKNMWIHGGTKWDRLKDQKIYEDKPTKADEDRLAILWPINDS